MNKQKIAVIAEKTKTFAIVLINLPKTKIKNKNVLVKLHHAIH